MASPQNTSPALQPETSPKPGNTAGSLLKTIIASGSAIFAPIGLIKTIIEYVNMAKDTDFWHTIFVIICDLGYIFLMSVFAGGFIAGTFVVPICKLIAGKEKSEKIGMKTAKIAAIIIFIFMGVIVLFGDSKLSLNSTFIDMTKLGWAMPYICGTIGGIIVIYGWIVLYDAMMKLGATSSSESSN